MVGVLLCVLLGYLLGSLSPAALLSVMKQKSLTEHGTGNLGATNAMLVFGKKSGVLVMVIDIFKAYISVKIARLLFPKMAIAGLLAGCCAVLGHVFPFYMNFRGGKGVATLAGLVLAVDPQFFLILVAIGVTLALIADYAFALPVSASVLYPIMAGLRARSFLVFLLSAGVGGLIIARHRENFARVKAGTEIRVRAYLHGHTSAIEKK